MNYKKLNNITGWVVFLIASYVYLSTMEQTTSLWDCGEYITTANKLEVGHPPGAPFFMMLGRLFSAFVSPENAAMMVNSMSALSSSFCILFLFWTITMLGRKLAKKGAGEIDRNAQLAIISSGLVGALAYTFTDSFWFSAVEGEVYAMSSFFTAIVFWAILKWDLEVDSYNALEDKSAAAHPNRWILFIAYMIGLSIGVHLLNLLAIPAIVFVIYFKKYQGDKVNIGSFLLAGIISLATLVFIQNIVIPKTVSVAEWIERIFTNTIGLPFNSGAFFFVALLIGTITIGLMISSKAKFQLLNTAILGFALLMIGYSSFVMIMVRSSANPPLDENNPETLSQLQAYLGREQYGTWPKLYGQYWNTPIHSSCEEDNLGPAKNSYIKLYSLKTKSDKKDLVLASDTTKIKGLVKPLGLHVKFKTNKTKKVFRPLVVEKEVSFTSESDLQAYRIDCDSVNNLLSDATLPKILDFEDDISKGYINSYKGKKGDREFQSAYCTLFPRMYRQGEGDKYKVWCNYEGNPNKPLPALGQVNGLLQQINPGKRFENREQQYRALMRFANESGVPDNTKDYIRNIATGPLFSDMYVPSFSENMRYLFKYQFNWMYWRYFMWNFSGRQNDIQGYGLTGGSGKILEGNWLSGVDFIDSQRLGPQETLSNDIKLNKGYNRYFMLPLILGLIGLIYQLVKHPKSWFVIVLLFILTGVAIVLYLNQKPAEPRERDYAYAASFYAFSIWIGLGVWALFDATRSINFKQIFKSGFIPVLGVGASLFIIGSLSLYIQYLIDGNFAFGFTLLYISLIIFLAGLIVTLLGSIKNDRISVVVITIICLIIPGRLAYENWDDHDRSNRSMARDFAANYLNSCDQNAILFTNGDNDTFPLWYIQEVEEFRTDVRVANMSLLSTDWHINQMRKRAYDSDPLPINMQEWVYRSGTRDYVVVESKESKKYKSNSIRKKTQKVLAQLKKKVARPSTDFNNAMDLLQQTYWLKDIADSLEKDRLDYKNKGIGKGTTNLLIKGYKTPDYNNKAVGFLRLAGRDKVAAQLPNMLSSIEKTINKWPERWYSAQEAIDFISDNRHKKKVNFSCNEEYYVDFSNIYLEVNTENALKHEIITEEDLTNPKFKKVIQWRLKGSMLYKADLAVLSLLANYQWDRPIYFASIMGMQANRNLQKHMYCEGLTYKLTPVEYGGTGGTNVNKMLALLEGNYQLKNKKTDNNVAKVDTNNVESEGVGFKWGNMKGEGVLVDYYTMRMVQNLRLQMMKLSDKLIAQNRYDEAVKVLNISFEEMPIKNEQVPADDICYYMCSNYFEAGDTLKGTEIGTELAELQLQRLSHFASMDQEHLNYVWSELGKALFNVEMLREASLVGMNRSDMFTPDNESSLTGAVSFKEKGVLTNTSYDEVCEKIKTVFVENRIEKRNFFTNQQKFPVFYTQLWGGKLN